MEINYDAVEQCLDREPVIVLIGQSGCGKETLAKRILNDIRETLPDQNVLFLETGGLFRKYTPTFTPRMAEILKKNQNAGNRNPSCTASTMWCFNMFTEYYEGTILIDGSPRHEDEAKAMVEFFCDFLGKEMIVFFIDVTDEECTRRILARNELYRQQNREVRDDCATIEAIQNKLSWFAPDVLPAIQYLEMAPGCTVYTIKSDQQTTPEQVHQQVMEILASE
jgi:adenylate kinase family enzyme